MGDVGVLLPRGILGGSHQKACRVILRGHVGGCYHGA